MIEEEGIVLELKDGIAIVKAQRTTSCDKCATKSVCHGVSETDMVVEALNPINAKVGDRVHISIGAGTVIKGRSPHVPLSLSWPSYSARSWRRPIRNA